MQAYFIFDVESVGLHGEGFAVAGGVYLANGAAQWEFSYACPESEARGNADDRKWAKENVPVLAATHRLPAGVRDAFWKEWLKARTQFPSVLMAVECGWPVEARFLCACINDARFDSNRYDRQGFGPYPLHEIATYMAAAGMNPMAIYEREASEMPPHDPLADARLSARLLSQALGILNRVDK